MNSKEETYFLDTAIFISYTITDEDIEPYHSNCCKLFKNEKWLHSSETVKNELEKIKERRRKAYKLLLKKLSKNLNNEEIIHLIKQEVHISPNDEKHLKNLLNKITPLREEDKITYMRHLIKIWNKRIEKAKKKIELFCTPHTDTQIKEILIENSDSKFGELDAEILIDAYKWSDKGFSNPIFLTQDTGITEKHKEIEEIFQKYWNNYDPKLDPELSESKKFLKFLFIESYQP
ncbi:hypothetical protein [Methanonatronarchaeum sp. AMET-Sl]|uniref:hypothetical protein n=1 Tax=Methanonatronarchaeum sp. AMET-Sl TaxID=3037654 RepID=UPI00244DFA72|nr:hypothetical protein [Methanonatronarchaeum sp. AMET-Sl]WGI17886.1 hypothetical protein QEN48_02450 [Methanonatronarchaeum sp. AMET-Sl]